MVVNYEWGGIPMKKQWRLIAGFVLIFVIVLFAVFNNQSVAVNFLLAQVEAPLIIVIIASAFIGALIMSLVSTGTLWQQKKQIKTLKRELTTQQDTVSEGETASSNGEKIAVEKVTLNNEKDKKAEGD